VNDEAWKSRQIVFYYQWVPIILLAMSVMSLLPMLIWRFLSRRSGIDVCALMLSAAARQQAGYAELRERTVRYVVNQVSYCIKLCYAFLDLFADFMLTFFVLFRLRAADQVGYQLRWQYTDPISLVIGSDLVVFILNIRHISRTDTVYGHVIFSRTLHCHYVVIRRL